MSNYHTKEEFERRLAHRGAHYEIPSPVRFFYHIACMPGFESVVEEQLRLCDHAGVDVIHACVLGKEEQARWCQETAARHNVMLHPLRPPVDDFGPCEGPTLDEVHKWAVQNEKGCVVYFHTKGVSNPADRHKRQWRRVMMREVVALWERNLRVLSYADAVGCAWQESRDFPHYSGNFWGARCDWLSRLQNPLEYRLSRPDFSWGRHQSWRQRVYAETWLGSKPWHHIESLHHGAKLWLDQVFELPHNVPGFSY